LIVFRILHAVMIPPNDDILFDNEPELDSTSDDVWTLLIVDDEPAVHEVTRYTLGSFRFRRKGMRILSAYSGAEAITIMQHHHDIALVLLDVVMETRNAGLRCAARIRNELHNTLVRIILRTGQPGDAPQLEVMLKYDINDYKEKGDLTEIKLLSAVTAALRSYADLTTIEHFRQTLEAQVAERTLELRRAHEELQIAHRQVAEVQQRQERELLEARALQRAMLPKELPKAEWYRVAAVQETASEVGGDYYDFFPQEDGSVLIVCGDATGHGLKAGMMVTLTKALLMVFNGQHSPEESARKIGNIIKAMRLGNLFMGLTLAHVTKERVSIVSAGMPPVLLRRRECSIEAIIQKTMPLGAIANYPFAQVTVPLSSCDTVLFSSDGFAESFNQHQEMLGEEALSQLLLEKGILSPSEFLAECVRAEEDWRGAEERHDDMTLVAIQIL